MKNSDLLQNGFTYLRYIAVISKVVTRNTAQMTCKNYYVCFP